MIHLDIHKVLHGSQGEMNLDVKLEIQKGEFIALMGESGSGKTTLLRILAGLEKAEGKIEVENVFWMGEKKMLACQERQIGFVFQDYALFENMTVEQNLLFVKDDKALALKLLALTELNELASRNVKSLSGGQKQRVSLCRAMMNKPKLLLMDEPLSSLDAKMRVKLQNEIVKLHKEFGTTTIMVSHDTEASYTLADRILVLDQGKVIKDGAKDKILQKVTTTTYSL
ncbi:MAG: ABC transporter ATP-binding protein [Epsilonproteobacteria bacterium]|nr:MAG: ABC transporter ATP-binding protein [Campylobacterota bacterium]